MGKFNALSEFQKMIFFDQPYPPPFDVFDIFPKYCRFLTSVGLFFINFFDKFINSPYIFKEKILKFELPLNVVEKKP